MARGQTRIIEGARSPADLDNLLAKDEAESQRRAILRAAGSRSAPQVPPAEKPDYPTRFVSEADTYILSLDITTENPDGTVKHHPFNVRLSNTVVDISLKKFPFSTRRVSEEIQKSSGYGLGKRFWDYDEQERALTEAQKNQQFKTARAAMKDPELRAALLAELRENDFDLAGSQPQPPDSTP